MHGSHSVHRRKQAGYQKQSEYGSARRTNTRSRESAFWFVIVGKGEPGGMIGRNRFNSCESRPIPSHRLVGWRGPRPCRW